MDELNYFMSVSGFKNTDKDYRDIQIREAKENQTEHLNSSINLEEVEVNGIKKSMIVIPHNSNNNIMIINALPDDTFQIGQIVKCFSQYWIITSKKQDEKIQCKGEMTLANHLLKWQDFEHIIRNIWCVVNDPYSRSPRENDVTNTAYSSIQVYIPYNTYTKKLFVDQRFIMWNLYNKDGKQIPDVYKIIDLKHKNTDFGENKIIIANMMRDLAHDNDNVEKGIADYVEGFDDIVTDGYIVGKSNIKAGYGSRTYKADFPEEIRPVWQIECEKDISKVNYDISNNNLVVSVDSENINKVGKIKIMLSDEQGLYGVSEKYVEVL